MRAAALAAVCVVAACRGRPPVPILNYHSVGEGGDESTVPRAAFAQQLDWLVSQGLATASLRDLVEGKLPKRSVILTFDDGKEDALRVVAPMLRQRGMRGTFFIVTGLVGKRGYLDWDGVRALAAAGMEIGSHSVDHARLADLPDERVRAELVDSRREIESQLGMAIGALAYPFNASRARIVRAARDAGYRVAVSGPAHGGAGLLELYRFPVSGRTSLAEIGSFVSAGAKQ